MFKAQKQTNEKCYSGVHKYRGGRWPERLHFLRRRLIYFGSSVWKLPRLTLQVAFWFLEDVSTSPVIYNHHSLQNSNAVLYEILVSRGMFQKIIAQRKLTSSYQTGSEKNKCSRRMLLLRTERSKWRSLDVRRNVRWRTVRLRMCQAAEKIRFKLNETFEGNRRKNQTLLFSLMILSVEYSPCSS
jgi:hypothetical protein